MMSSHPYNYTGSSNLKISYAQWCEFFIFFLLEFDIIKWWVIVSRWSKLCIFHSPVSTALVLCAFCSFIKLRRHPLYMCLRKWMRGESEEESSLGNWLEGDFTCRDREYKGRTSLGGRSLPWPQRRNILGGQHEACLRWSHRALRVGRPSRPATRDPESSTSDILVKSFGVLLSWKKHFFCSCQFFGLTYIAMGMIVSFFGGGVVFCLWHSAWLTGS